MQGFAYYSPFLTSLSLYSSYPALSFLFFSQGSVLDAAVYGLEPHSRYSLLVVAVNGAGRLFMISSSFDPSGNKIKKKRYQHQPLNHSIES